MFNYRIKGVNMVQQITMINIDYELNLHERKLTICYSSLYSKMTLPMKGELSGDGRTFFVQSSALGTCRDLSQNEINEIKKYVSNDSKVSKGIEIVFM